MIYSGLLELSLPEKLHDEMVKGLWEATDGKMPDATAIEETRTVIMEYCKDSDVPYIDHRRLA